MKQSQPSVLQSSLQGSAENEVIDSKENPLFTSSATSFVETNEGGQPKKAKARDGQPATGKTGLKGPADEVQPLLNKGK
jgi:hypothetical protein